jgi:hypothetical protein
MSRKMERNVAAGLLLLISACGVTEPEPVTLTGEWEGELVLNASPLVTATHLRLIEEPDGLWARATTTSPRMGSQDYYGVGTRTGERVSLTVCAGDMCWFLGGERVSEDVIRLGSSPTRAPVEFVRVAP